MSDPSDNPTATRQTQWPRFVIEGVVIVASILLAFGIEAWWAEVQDREDEREIHRSFRAPLVVFHVRVTGFASRAPRERARYPAPQSCS